MKTLVKPTAAQARAELKWRDMPKSTRPQRTTFDNPAIAMTRNDLLELAKAKAKSKAKAKTTKTRKPKTELAKLSSAQRKASKAFQIALKKNGLTAAYKAYGQTMRKAK